MDQYNNVQKKVTGSQEKGDRLLGWPERTLLRKLFSTCGIQR